MTDVAPKPKTRHDWLLHLITAIISILGTLGVMQAHFFEFRASQLDLAYQRINTLEERMDRLQRELVEKDAAITALQLKTSARPDPLQALYSYVEGMGTPAWIKLWDPKANEFRMLYLNSDYESVYNVSRAFYIGSTDSQVHAADRAKIYRENDLKIIKSRSFREFVEPALNRNGDTTTYEPTHFWKFYVRLPDGRELVCGIQLGPEKKYKDIRPNAERGY